jgi:L-2-hydroxyglutarate oxidase LhgO
MLDIVVVGAGIVGLASARELLRRHPNLRLAVVDKEDRIAAHQTGRNSGVIHSGIYYAPGSLKARLCQEGREALYAYCAEKEIPTVQCGKVIVATSGEELPRLRALFERGQHNQIPGIELIGPERLRELEPHCVGVQAIWSPITGIVDYTRVCQAYAADIAAMGGEVRLGVAVHSIAVRGVSAVIATSAGDIEARNVLACAGVFSDRLAAASGAAPEPRIVPFRGDYWVIRPERGHLCRGNIYPVPDARFPFLGVHLTKRIHDGSILVGPNAVLAFAREGYGKLDVNLRDLAETARSSGFRALAAKFWKTGLDEYLRDFSKSRFLKSVQAFVPEVRLEDMHPAPAGIRAQALAPDGSLVDDFVFSAQPRVLHVRNAPSPGATSSLAIARHIADQAADAFNLG